MLPEDLPAQGSMLQDPVLQASLQQLRPDLRCPSRLCSDLCSSRRLCSKLRRSYGLLPLV